MLGFKGFEKLQFAIAKPERLRFLEVFAHADTLSAIQPLDKPLYVRYTLTIGTEPMLFDIQKEAAMRFFITSAGVACATILALCFAALSAAHWILELSGQTTAIIALAVVASVCVSLLGPACAFLARSHGWVLVLPALVFIASDCYQNTLGYQTVKGLTVLADVQAAEARLATAQAALDNLPLPDANGQIRQRDTWQAVNDTLTERRDNARADLAALQKPKTANHTIISVMAIIQVALSLVFGCLGKPKRKPEPEPAPAKVATPKPKPEPVYDPNVISIMDKIAEQATR